MKNPTSQQGIIRIQFENVKNDEFWWKICAFLGISIVISVKYVIVGVNLSIRCDHVPIKREKKDTQNTQKQTTAKKKSSIN